MTFAWLQDFVRAGTSGWRYNRRPFGNLRSTSLYLLRLTPAVTLLHAGCASSPPPPVPVVSPTGIVYEIGIPPVETRFSQASSLFLSQGFYDRALEQAQEGLEEDGGRGEVNALHHLLAGLSFAGLGDFDSAMVMWDRALEIYPAYELEVEPARETAWAEAFNAGIEAYDRGEIDSTLVVWGKAVEVYDLRPDVHRNLATLLAEDGRFEEAIEVYRAGLAGTEKLPASWVLTEEDLATRAAARRGIERELAQLYLILEEFELAEPLIRGRLSEEPGDIVLLMGLGTVLVEGGRSTEARDHYVALLRRNDLRDSDYLNIGVSLFEVADYSGAATAFRRVTEFHPFGRDAWFNYANALLALESWPEIVSIGPKLSEVDPLGENSALILAQAHLASDDEAGAIREFERTLFAPVHLGDLRMEPLGLETAITGRLVGNEAPPGSEVRLRFLFYSGEDVLGSEVLELRAPEKEGSVSFEVRFSRSAAAYRYELIGVGDGLGPSAAESTDAAGEVSAPNGP